MVELASVWTEPVGETPVVPGWYVARMKSWADNGQWAIVQVTMPNGRTAEVWQAGSEESRPASQWVFREQIRIR